MAFGALVSWSRPAIRSVCVVLMVLSGCGLVAFDGYGTYVVPDRALAYNSAVETALVDAMVKSGTEVPKSLRRMRCTPDRFMADSNSTWRLGPADTPQNVYRYKCLVSLDGMKSDFVFEKMGGEISEFLRESIDGKLNFVVTRVTLKDGSEMPLVKVYATPERVSAQQAGYAIFRLMAYALPTAVAKRDAEITAKNIEKANRASWQEKSNGS